MLACSELQRSALAVPAVVAADTEGVRSAGPAALLTWRPGRSRLDPLDDAAIDAVARTAVAVHAQTVAEERRPPTFALRGPLHPEVPTWAGRPEVWERAIAIGRRVGASAASGLVHHDFHLGNVLWDGGVVAGVIDWAETSWGPPDLDVAHMSTDLALMHDPSAAQRFRAAYVRAGGQLQQEVRSAQAWQVSDVLGFLPDPAHILPAVATARPDLSADVLRVRLEDLLASTLDAGWSPHG